MLKRLFGLGLVLAAGLAAGAALRAEPYPGTSVPLVFIHGIKGSRLVDGDGALRWIGATGALGLATPELALPKRFENGLQARDGLYVGGLLETVVVIPKLLEFDVYGSWADAADGLKRPFYPFAYDWRRENTETSAAFLQFLEEIKKKHGAAPQVVAHSMGGLIALPVLLARPDLFQSVVFAGVPFAGGIGFLPDVHAGRREGLSKTILAPAVLATFPSVFGLFPNHAEDRLITADGKTIDVDFFALDSWCALKLGPCATGVMSDEDRAFYTELFAHTKAHRGRLDAAPEGALPKVLVVASKKHPTLVRAIQGGPKSESGWDFETAPKEAGDGRVVFEHAMPPKSVPYEVVETDAEHAALLGDPKVVDAIAKLGENP